MESRRGMFTSLRHFRILGSAILAVTAAGGISPLFFPGVTRASSQSPAHETSSSTPSVDRPSALLVGGGPTPEHNQIAIESNLRYLLKLLPNGAERTVLFADGDREKETVLFEATAKPLKPAEHLLALLLSDRDDAHPSNLKYRKPSLAQIDGPSKKEAVTAAFDRLVGGSSPSKPLLIYFTGHGSPNRARDFENNEYDLWQEGT